MRKKAFRRFLAIALMIVVGVFVAKSCAPGIKTRLLDDQPRGHVHTYQKSVENRTQKKIGSILKQVYGKDAYFVSVVATLHEAAETYEAKRVIPKTVSSNLTEKTTYEMMSSKNLAIMEKRPESRSTRKSYGQNHDKIRRKMPGLISRINFMPGYGTSLPGFPAIATPSVAKQFERHDQNEDPSRSMADEKTVFTKETLKDHVYYDEIVEAMSTPDTKIERLYVSVVVDKERFEERGVPKEELSRLIQNMAGIYPDRGDQVVISMLPMKHPWINIEKLIGTYAPYVESTKQYVKRNQRVFMGLFGLLVLYLLWKLMKRLLAFQKTKKEKRLEDARLKKAAEDEEEQKIQQSIGEEKRQAITELAKEKPSEFATLLLNWAEKE